MTALMIPARPTTYKGIQMRSRLEARVAAALDADGIDWAYEERAFAGDGGQYLPDFRITLAEDGLTVYFEAKPTIEAAWAVMPRMTVIWESDPAAVLSIYADTEAVVWTAGANRVWRLYRWGC